MSRVSSPITSCKLATTIRLCELSPSLELIKRLFDEYVVYNPLVEPVQLQFRESFDLISKLVPKINTCHLHMILPEEFTVVVNAVYRRPKDLADTADVYTIQKGWLVYESRDSKQVFEFVFGFVVDFTQRYYHLAYTCACTQPMLTHVLGKLFWLRQSSLLGVGWVGPSDFVEDTTLGTWCLTPVEQLEYDFEHACNRTLSGVVRACYAVRSSAGSKP